MQWKKLADLEYRFYPEGHNRRTGLDLYTLEILGPRGCVQAREQVQVLERADYLELVYQEIISVLEGNYHCCLTPVSTFL